VSAAAVEDGARVAAAICLVLLAVSTFAARMAYQLGLRLDA
jgi:hypothetical protein